MNVLRKDWTKFSCVAIIIIIVILYGCFKLRDVISGGGTIAVLCGVTLVSGTGFFLLLDYLLIFRSPTIWKIYLVMGVYFGVMFVLLIPTGCTPDEIEHFDSTYELSNELEGRNGIEFYRIMQKRESDVGYQEHLISADTYEAYYQKFTETASDDWVWVENKGSYHSIVYLPGTIGIGIAKLLHLNYGWLTVVGTLCQMFFFLTVISYAIRILPIGKKTLLIIALLPMTLQQSSSFSYDNMVISMSILVTSISLRWVTGTKDSLRQRVWQGIFFVVAAIMLLQVKNGLYALIALFPLGFLLKKIFGNKKNRHIGIIIALCGLFLIIGAFVFTDFKEKIAQFITQYHYIEKRDVWSGSISYYATNPALTLQMFLETLRTSVIAYLSSMLGGLLGWLQIGITGKVIWPMALLLLLSVIRTKEEEKEAVYLKAQQRIYILTISVIVCLLCFVAMLLFWTPIFSNVIEGVQGRYFLPVLLGALMAVGYWRRPVWPGVVKEYFFALAMGILDFMVLIFLLEEAAAF